VDKILKTGYYIPDMDDDPGPYYSDFTLTCFPKEKAAAPAFPFQGDRTSPYSAPLSAGGCSRC